MGEIVHYLPDQQIHKFKLPLKLSLLHGLCPKSARASPHNVLSPTHFIQIGSL